MENLQRYLKYSYIPGLILAIAGLVAGLTTGTWSPLYIGLLVAGSILLLIWLGLILSTSQEFWRKRSTQAGTNVLLSTLAILVILGLINFLAVRSSARIDLTENQLFTLSPQTQEVVKNLKQPVKVWVFDNQPSANDKAVLENYRRGNSNFQFEFVDPDLKPGLAKEFNVKSLGDVYLEYGAKKQLVQSLVAYNQREPLSEIKLTNGIEKIKRDRIPNIYFLQGHGESSLDASKDGLSEAVSSLKDKGFKVEPLNLVTSPGIPQDTNVIVIAGSKRKLFPEEVQALNNYANRGGNLLLMIDPETDSGLESLLTKWGVDLDQRIVLDASGSGELVGLGPAAPIITNYGDHPITKEFKNGISIYPLSRPVATVKKDGIEAVALLVTNDKMWAEKDLNSEEANFDPTQDLPGPFDLGVALTRTQSSNESKTNTKPENRESKMVVIGNSTFATNTWFKQQLNGDVFLNSVQWLASEDGQTLSIRPKESKNRRINLTPLQAGLISWLSLVIIPLLGLTLAGITWWRRR